MYAVGNDLARLRAQIARESSPAEWTPVSGDAPAGAPSAGTATEPAGPVADAATANASVSSSAALPDSTSSVSAVALASPTRSATWASMKPVLTRLSTKSGCAKIAARKGMLVATPPTRNSRSVRVALCTTSVQSPPAA